MTEQGRRRRFRKRLDFSLATLIGANIAVKSYVLVPPMSSAGRRKTTGRPGNFISPRQNGSPLHRYYPCLCGDKNRRSIARFASIDEPDEKNSERFSISRPNMLNAVLLIAGTTVGGGFLAIPSVVAPIGFIPSAVGMTGVWAFFIAQSFVLADCIINARKNRTTTIECNQKDGIRNGDAYELEVDHPGIAATAKSAFGYFGEYATAALLAVLTEATLVSQIARAGSLFPSSMYRIGCATVALTIGAAVFGPRRGMRVAASLNSALTGVFIASAALLFIAGCPSANWARLSGSTSSLASLPSAIPTFLQLLVYAEILPVVCQILRYDRSSIRWAIVFGSLMPLLLEVGWSGLGIGLVSPGTRGDPVSALLAAGPVQAPLFVLAISAILTTVIGSYLALNSIFDDVFPDDVDAAEEANGTTKDSPSWRRRLTAATSIILPGLLIASISPSLFLKAIDFAGSYPVLILSGVLPPAIALVQEKSMRREGKTGLFQPKQILVALLAISLYLMGTSAVQDILALVSAR